MNSRFNYVIFSIACLSGIAVRTIMLLFIIDPVSGFIYTDYASPSIGLIAVLIAAAVSVFALTLFAKKNRDKTASLKTIPFYVASAVMAAAIGYETFLSPLLSKSNAMQSTLLYLLSAGAIAAFIIITVFGFLKKEYHPAITLLPVVFWIMRLIIVFTDFSTISTISETVIETFSMCLTLVTFLFFSKLECGRVNPKHYTLVAATALLNAYVCAIGSMPRIFAGLLSMQQPTHMNIIPAFTGLATAVFSATFAFTLLHSVKED